MSTSSSNSNTQIHPQTAPLSVLSASLSDVTACLITPACSWESPAASLTHQHQQTLMLLPPVWEADTPLTPLRQSGPSHLSPTTTLALLHSATVPGQSPQARSGPHSLPLRPSECPTLPCTGQSQLLYGLSNTLHHQAVPCLQPQCTLLLPHSCCSHPAAFGRHYAVPCPCAFIPVPLPIMITQASLLCALPHLHPPSSLVTTSSLLISSPLPGIVATSGPQLPRDSAVPIVTPADERMDFC